MDNSDAPNPKNSVNNAQDRFLWPALMGIGIGVLVGLSVSPVVGSVLGAVLAMISAAMAVLVGWTRPQAEKVDLAPVAVFVFLLMLGAMVGIVLREQNALGNGTLFGPSDTEAEIDKWVDLKFDEDIVRAAIFTERFPHLSDVGVLRIEPTLVHEKWSQLNIPEHLIATEMLAYAFSNGNSTRPQTSDVGQNSGGVLYNQYAESCKDLRDSIDSYGLSVGLSSSAVSRWRTLTIITDTETLEELVSKDLCPSEEFDWPWE